MFRCRLCGSKDVFVKYKFSACSVGYCRQCGFVQVLEKPGREKLFKDYGEEYFGRGKYVQDRAIARENKRRIDWLLKNGLKKGVRVLDVGCATGDFIKASENRFDMWGLDISEFAVEQARLNNPKVSQQIKAGMIEEQVFPDCFFDGIVLWDVIEHLWNPLEMVNKLVKMLKPNGMLAVSTPNIGALTARLMGKRWHFMTVPEHLSFFNRQTINFLLKTTGLTPVGWMTRGKWVNLGFLMYKINRVFPKLFPAFLGRWIKEKANVASVVLYLPTGDIQYVAAIKSNESKR